jgi:small subunit ribosomal protein S1
MFKEGDQVTAKVVNIVKSERKIGLSIRRLEEQEERNNFQEYLSSPRAATSNLGQLLKEELEGRANKLVQEDDKE